jgi:LL-diaminopimelate aminotransferase
MGSQDGLAHLALAVTDPGDVALVPDPGYPIYAVSLALAGVTPYFLPLRADNGFLPDLDAVPGGIWRKAKFMLLNFPANPVAATADLTFFERAAALARKHGVLIVHDLAYSEMGFDGYRPPSILEVPGAADIAVEFHSLSKSFNMAGCRIGFLAGNAEAVGALKELKANIDYGVFEAVQEAGIAALKEGIAALEAGRPGVSEIYERRRNAFLRQLRAEGWDVPAPKATMFVWAPLPFRGEETGDRRTSRAIAKEMLEETGVAVIPGDAFGREGEGYVRIALVEEPERLAEAARRIGAFIRNRAR